nr:ABC transporter substrate-binding protein [bacterium]
MKATRKITLVVLAVLLLAVGVCFAGCGKDEGTLVVGTNAAFEPFEFKDTNSPSGYGGIDMEMAQLIADELGLKLKIEDMEFTTLLGAMASGKCDIVIAGMSIKPERLENADFSTPYYKANQMIVVKADSTIASSADLKDKKVGVQSGTTGADSADALAADTANYGTLTVEKYRKGADAIMALKSGNIDAVVIDEEVAKKFIQNNDGLKDAGTLDTNEEYCIAVKKGDTEMLDKINGVLDKIMNDGRLDAIIEKYIPAE